MSRPVVSADDVRAVRKRGETRLAIPPGAIVTPLARDEAGRLGVELTERGAKEGGIPSDSHRHTATCDPDELSRLVERVRERVPGADPAQVLEIARRVLEAGGG